LFLSWFETMAKLPKPKVPYTPAYSKTIWQWNGTIHLINSKYQSVPHGIYRLLWISVKKHSDTTLEREERMDVPLVHNISLRQSIEYIAL
jgi:hypothetical protein